MSEVEKKKPMATWKNLLFGFMSVSVLVAIFSPTSSETDGQKQSFTSNSSDDTLNPKWKYFSENDAMTSKVSKSAIVQSRNFVNFEFPYHGAQRAELTVRRDPKFGNDVIFSLKKSQLTCQYNNCVVQIRFDDKKAYSLKVNKPADHSSNVYFLSGYAALLEQIKTAKTMKISVTQYKQGEHVFEFNVEGLDLNQ